MRTFFIAVLGGVCSLFAFFVLVFAVVVPITATVFGEALSTEPKRPVKDVIISVDLRMTYPDHVQNLPVPNFLSLGFVDVLTRLDAARHDDKVKGVILRVDWNGPGYARSEEIRQAILSLKEAGKFVHAHAQNLGLGLSGYRAIAAADHIAMQPGTEFFVSGINVETLFLKGALDKLGVVPQFEAIGAYKSGADTYTRQDYSEAQREEINAILASLLDEAIADIGADRDLSASQLREQFAATPFAASDAVSQQLIDSLAWPEDFLEAARQQADGAEIIPIQAYNPPPVPPGAVIALVAGQGTIITGGTDYRGGFSSQQITSDTMSNTILRAGRDNAVQALVIRIDSPGGSPEASEQIRRAIMRVRKGEDGQAGKPVVVSMGPVAASGGYWIALAGEYVLASRTSLTGSIGVYGGKLAIGDGLRKLGVEPRQINTGGEMVSAFSVEALSESQRVRFRQMLERTYTKFVGLVSESRKLSAEKAEAAAGGRVWTGAQALEIGLIDETGGLMQAVSKAADLAGIDETEPINLRAFNPELDILGVVSNALNLTTILARMAQWTDSQAWRDLIQALREGERPEARVQAFPLTAE